MLDKAVLLKDEKLWALEEFKKTRKLRHTTAPTLTGHLKTFLQ
jgi:hypothetical protein